MTNDHYKNLFRQSWHPSIDELLLYLDGEIQAKTNRKVEAHLRVCWSCRVKREKIDRFISAFMEHRRTLLTDSLNFPPEALPRFAAQLSDLELDSGGSNLFSHLVGWLRSGVFHRRFSLKYASFLLVCSSILFFLIRLSSVPPVSAKEVLQRAEMAEGQKLRQLPSAVVYQKLQLRWSRSVPGPTEFLTWEIWNDATNNRSRQRVEDARGRRLLPLEESDVAPLPGTDSLLEKTREDPSSLPPILAELEQVFQANHMDPRRPLSAASYEAWRRSIRTEAGEVIQTILPSGGEALTLKTVAPGPFARNAIIEADLVIRTEDWHPIEQLLKVQGQQGLQEYALSEAAFEVVALNSLSPSIFADVNLPRAPLAIPQTAIASPAVAPTAVELTAAEVEAHYALHLFNACLGDPIEVLRDSSDEILVRGLAEAEERKKELVAALERIPHVTVSIQTVAEAKAAISSSSHAQDGTQNQEPGPEFQESEVVKVHSGKLPIQNQLERYFLQARAAESREGESNTESVGIAQKIADFSTKAVSLSNDVLSEAWALRQLSEDYPARQKEGLRPATRWLLGAMIRDHTTGLRLRIDQLRMLLEPVLTSFGDERVGADSGMSDSPDSAESAWAARALRLFAIVQQIHQITSSLFAASEAPGQQGEYSPDELLPALDRVSSELQEVEAVVAGEFSDDKEQLTMKDLRKSK